MNAPTSPVIVGVGQLRANRDRRVGPAVAREPLELIADAVGRALADAGVPAERLLGEVAALDVVRVMSWSYDDLPGDLARRLGIRPRLVEHTDVGGNQPVALLDRAARRIAAGAIEVAVICGGEAQASSDALARAGHEPGWSRRPGGRAEWPPLRHATETMLRYGMHRALRGYPFYENRLAHELGQTFEQSQRWSAELLATFTEAAAGNEAAWDPVVRSADALATATADNRMICHPYTLRMVAQPSVDQAAAVIVASAAAARRVGVPGDRQVHVWSGAGAADTKDLLARPTFSASPPMEAVLGVALDDAGLVAGDLDVVDLYSCFPVVPKLAARALGLADGTRLSATGGLNAFGQPGNDYAMHAIVAVARALRADPAGAGDGAGAGESRVRTGLVYGNGEVVTKHHAAVLASAAHPSRHPGRTDPVWTVDAAALHAVHDGPADDVAIVTFTADHARNGSPEVGYVVGETADGARIPALVHDRALLARLVDPAATPIGSRAQVIPSADGRNELVPT